MPTISCPNCKIVLRLPDDMPSTRVKCRACRTTFDMPAPQKSAPSPVPPPIPPVPSPPPAPSQSVKPSVAPPLPPLRSRPPLPARLTQPAVPAHKTLPADSNLPTVIAHRSESAPVAARRMHRGWMVGSFIAFVAPILTTSTLMVWRSRGEPNANPTLTYAGIEIGAKGPRYCLVEFHPPREGGENFRVVDHRSTSAGLAVEMKKTGRFDQAGLDKTIERVKNFYDRLMTDHQVPSEQIVIVSSEDLFDPIAKDRPDLDQKDKDRLIAQCRETLSAAVFKATGQKMEFVKSQQVAEHQLKAVVPKNELTDAIFLDIGGGSTRCNYLDAADVIRATKVTGIRGFIDIVNDRLNANTPFKDRAVELADPHLREPFRTEFGKEPELKARRKIYLAGGIVWVMANCQCPGDEHDYVHLRAGDIKDFTDKVRDNPDFLTKLVPDATLPPERQKKLKVEYGSMRTAFNTPERLVAGSEILRALSIELQFEGRAIWFYRHCEFAWLASYIEVTRRPRP